MIEPQLVWPAALEQFKGGYGAEPDFENETDRCLFMGCLEREIRADIEGKLSKMFTDSAARLREAAGLPEVTA